MQVDASLRVARNHGEGSDASSAAINAALGSGHHDGPIRIDPEAFYTERDAAALLRKSLQTVRRYRREGSTLPFTRYGREVYYLGSDIINMLKGGRQRSTSDARA